MPDRAHILSGLAAEVAFAVLPLLVVLMVVIHATHPSHFFASPEWSFGSAILFGQALVKFVSGIAYGGRAAKGPVGLIVALVVVFGLVPSLFVLNTTLQAWEESRNPARWLQVFQVMYFVGASSTYMLLGVIGATWTKD